MTKKKIFKGAIAIVYLCMLFEGGSNMLLSATKTQLMQMYHVNLSQISILFTVRSIVCGLAPFFCGKLSDLYGRKKAIFVGCLLFLTYYVMVPTFAGFQLTILLTVLLGLGYSLMDPSAQAVLFDSFDDATPMMPYVQVAFAGGSILIPLAVSFLTSRNLDWKMSYYGYLIMAVGLGAFVFFQKFPQPRNKTSKQSEAAERRTTFLYEPKPMREGLMIFLFVVCNTLVCSVVTNYADVYLQNMFRVSAASSVRILSIYECGGIVGAVFMSRIATRVHASKLMFLCPIFTFLTFFLALFMKSSFLFTLFITLSGLTTCSMFSIAVSLAGQLFWKNAGAATGAVSSASAVGMVLTSAFVGVAISQIGIHWCYVAASAVGALNILVGYVVLRQYRNLVGKKAV